MKTLKTFKKDEFQLSTAIFKNRILSFSECIIVYFKEIQRLGYAEIARLMNRDRRNVFSVYQKACEKLGDTSFIIDEKQPFFYIPIEVVQDRSMSVLENVVFYLKETFGLKNHDIGILLNRDDRTVWTVYQRAKKRNE